MQKIYASIMDRRGQRAGSVLSPSGGLGKGSEWGRPKGKTLAKVRRSNHIGNTVQFNEHMWKTPCAPGRLQLPSSRI